KAVGKLELPSAALSVSLSTVNKRVLTVEQDGSVRVLDLEKLVPGAAAAAVKPPPGKPWAGHTGRITSVVFSPSGSGLMTGGEDGGVRVWEAGTGQAIRTFELGEPVLAARFCDNARRVFAFG